MDAQTAVADGKRSRQGIFGIIGTIVIGSCGHDRGLYPLVEVAATAEYSDVETVGVNRRSISHRLRLGASVRYRDTEVDLYALSLGSLRRHRLKLLNPVARSKSEQKREYYVANSFHHLLLYHRTS